MTSSAKHPAQAALTTIQNDPVWFIEDAFGETLAGYQRRICKSVRDNRNTSVCSCHGIGKSFIAGRIAHWFLQAFPHSIVITTAPTFRQVEDVLWKEIRSAHYKARINLGGKMNSVDFTLQPDWYAIGLSTNEPDRFQGYHAPYILVIVDESSGVAEPIFQAIEGVASTGYVRILELGNPTDPGGHFNGTFKSPFYSNIEVGCFHTPNFKPFRAENASGAIDEEASLELLRGSTEEGRQAAIVKPYLIAPQWVYERMTEWGVDTPMFQSRCLGHFPLEGENTLIPLSLALRAKWYRRDSGAVECQNLIAGQEEVLGVDVADQGDDSTVFAHRIGNQVVEVIRYRKQGLMETVGKVVRWQIAHPNCKINIDSNGVGSGVFSRLREIGVRNMRGINVGTSPRNKELYENLRAELYWSLRTRFTDHDIAIPDDDKLVSDLTSPMVVYKSSGKIMIEKKSDMRKRGVASPDSADAVMLAFASTGAAAYMAGPEEEDDGSGSGGRPDDGPITGGLLEKEY